jgi:hypothetical protein
MEDGWGYEDDLPCDITDAMFEASIVDFVRMYPYVNTPFGRQYVGIGDLIERNQ